MKHIESVRAEVFAGVIGRTETDRTRYRDPSAGMSARKAVRFTAPPDRAHWADMLAELRQALPGLPDLSFDTVLSPATSGPTRRVRDALADAVPVARLARRLSERFGVDNLTPWPVDAVVNAKYLTTTPRTDLPRPSATAMPEIVEAVVEQARQEQKVLAPVRLLTQQSRTYLDSDGHRIGRLLAATALSYGVVGAGTEMTALARNWSTPDWALASAMAADVVVAAAETGQLFYADGAAAATVLGRPGTQTGALPSPAGAGVLLLQSGAMLAWQEVGARLEIAFTSNCLGRVQREGRLNHAVWSILSVDAESGIVDSYGSTRGLEMLARLAGMLEKPPVASRREQRRERDTAAAERPVVVVRYTARPGSPATRSSGGSRELDALKWRVRGHYRRQWYPSVGEHRLIWIEEHFAERGEDGELLERPVVTKLSQPRGARNR